MFFSNFRGARAGCAPACPLYKLPKHTYTRPEEAGVTSLLNSICNFDFVVTIVIVQMCLAFKKGLSRSLDLAYFIVNYITFGSDTSYSNL